MHPPTPRQDYAPGHPSPPDMPERSNAGLAARVPESYAPGDKSNLVSTHAPPASCISVGVFCGACLTCSCDQPVICS